MRVLPVLDVKDGVVVRGVGGRRDEYRPIISRWTDSVQPVEVAEALRRQFGLAHLYLADLDAIAGAAPALDVYRALHSRGFDLWVDAGIRDEATALADVEIDGIVVGLETVHGPEALGRLIQRHGAARIVFSLDLKHGAPLHTGSAWPSQAPLEIAATAIARGVRQIILLDLARVGSGTGPGTEELCRQLTRTYHSVELAAGGGVRDADDLRRLEQSGARTALVASALHDGRLRLENGHWTNSAS